ncbi:DUF2264 domain-containing protein [Microbacterium pumilum]|uniref:DUF2264 domain-containing protein n=1 Tax=Microbacterium pumilum TaxID=344165 RepID=A0ABN2S4P9_9MICO
MTPERSRQPSGGNVATDWTREEWLAYADGLLDTAARFASPGHGQVLFPGAEGGYGRAVDGLEGFARTFLLAGFRIAGERGAGVDDLIQFYAEGIATGVDPDAPDRWVRLDEHAQAKVEAASIALILDMTRPWLWDKLDTLTQRRVIDYLAPAVGDDTYPRTNWLWFRLVVQTFLRSVGGPWSPADIAADLALHDSFVRADGWLSDGPERSYDHYVGWALHLYPVLWARMRGAADLAGGRTATDVARLDRFLQDAVALVGADGSPLIQGRSLIYRFAAAAPFWVGVIAEVPSVSPGLLRHAATKVVTHFADHGVPTAEGLLTMGWHDEWRALAQSYSGPGSPYWAAKGLIGIALPADHPVWAAAAEPLPAEVGDTLAIVRAAGWALSGTAADGIVRVVNHGTDHAAAGTLVGDSPLYARLGYSTATSPLLDDAAWHQPLEQSVALIDAGGHATHRAALELADIRIQDDDGGRIAIAGSTWLAHWIDPDTTQRHHGSGWEGRVNVAGRLTVHSIVRGPWELRLARFDDPRPDCGAVRLRVGGWPLAAGVTPLAHTAAATAGVSVDGLRSGIRSLRGAASAEVVVRPAASPLGAVSSVPVLDYAVAPGEWVSALIELTADPAVVARALSADLAFDLPSLTAVVTWPDGVVTRSRLIDLRESETA